MFCNNWLSRRAFVSAAAAAVGACAWPFAHGAERKKKLVMLAGRPSHGPLEHEFNAGILLLKKCLSAVPGLEITSYKNGWPDKESAFEGASGIVLYADGGQGHPFIQEDRLTVIGDFMRRGVGLMCLHYAVEVPKDRGGRQFLDWIGGYYETHWSCNPIWQADFKELPEHPITRGLKPFAIRDEWYFNLRFRPEMKGITPILSATPNDATRDGPYVSPRGPYEHVQKAKGRTEVLMWAVERPDGGRGIGFTGGHFHENWKDDNFRKAVLNAAVWLCKLKVPRDGVASTVTDAEITENLDPKPPKKKK